jgi:ribose 5-phosphate isomerase B
MRVHLGSDHAGLDLKDHLVTWLVDQGHEIVDHGPFVYDALDDYPCFCLRAAEGIRCALVWSEETAVLAREHNDANVVSVGGRMHSLDDMTRFVEVFLATPFSGDERHVRRIGQLTTYDETKELPPLPESALRGSVPDPTDA